MYAYRVYIFHAADGNGLILWIPHHFKFYFLEAFDAFFHQHLMDGWKVESIDSNVFQLFFVIGKSASCAAQRKCRSEHNRITDLSGSLFGFPYIVGYLWWDNGFTYGLAHFLEKFPVLGSLYALAAGPKKLYAALSEHAFFFKLHGQIEACLSSYPRDYGVWSFVS